MIVKFKAGAAALGYAYFDGDLGEITDDQYSNLQDLQTHYNITVVVPASPEEVKEYKASQKAN